ncbi:MULTISPECIES: hypothetical protein [Cupriavidus]|uniref:hypothetical protein n=1 Tax=Cupriavidus TaxID=106589 RepID=UPI0012465A48|nr:hypothetical protein [Cupriavidus oxalaticus]
MTLSMQTSEMLSALPTAISAGALFVSLLALAFTRRSWLETNRPIITAEIVKHDGGNEAMAFNLVVHNVGNRPATDIRLSARPEAISEIVDSGARERYTGHAKMRAIGYHKPWGYIDK